MALLEVKNIYKSFGGVKAIQDFSLAADAGQIHGIIGPNGAGKTTIFNVISGVYPADQGSVTLNGQDITKIEQYKITRPEDIQLPSINLSSSYIFAYNTEF